MNFEGKKPLGIRCPECGVYGHHPTVATDPSSYRYNDESTTMFITYLEADICYRIREKKCTNCDKRFKTVEFAQDFLSLLVPMALRTDKAESKIVDLQNQLSKVTSQNDALKKQVKSISDIVVPQKKKKIRSKKKTSRTLQ